jgi:hypothetical protein
VARDAHSRRLPGIGLAGPRLAVLKDGEQLRRKRRQLVGEERLVGRALELAVAAADADLRFDGAMMPREMPSPPVGAGSVVGSYAVVTGS